MPAAETSKNTVSVPRLSEIARVFARVGTIGFGGGVGMLALIRQEIVERRRWVDDAQLSVAVAMGQMLPGPFVSNYAEYIGYELRGMKGMGVAVIALLAPCFVLMCGLSFLYFRFGSVPLVTKLFAGVQPVVRHPDALALDEHAALVQQSLGGAARDLQPRGEHGPQVESVLLRLGHV